jgi:3-hydroxyisobutyrate dehydrogenase
MNKLRIAFFGLGLMGSGMAQRLLAAGFPLTVFNRDAQKTHSLARGGAQVATSPREAASHADVIVSMVSDDEASNRIWLGHDGALSGIRPGTICIECSTLTVNWVQSLTAEAAAAGGEFLDAPVTGSKTHAAAGELNFIVGGNSATLEKVRPVLAAMSKSIVLLGPVGSGAFFKLINNFMCGVQVAALAEAVALIERGGLDRGRAVDLLKGGAAGSPLVQTVAARMMSADFTPHFLLRLMTKDLRYALQEGQKLSLDLKTATAALTDFQNSIAAQDGDKDIAAVVEQFRRRN